MNSRKKRIDNKQGLTNILIGVFALLLILIGYLGINIIITNNKLSKIDKEIDKINSTPNDTSTENKEKFDKSNSLNTKNIEYKNEKLSSVDDKLGVKVVMSKDGKTANITIDWSIFKDKISKEVTGTYPTSKTEYTVNGFNKNIKSVLLSQTDNTISSLTVIYLMEDNTVQYTKLIKQKSDGSKYVDVKTQNNTNYFSTDGAIAKVTDVYRLYNIDATENNKTYKTVVGLKSDGKFYDLGYIIKENN